MLLLASSFCVLSFIGCSGQGPYRGGSRSTDVQVAESDPSIGDTVLFGEHSATGKPKDIASALGANTPLTATVPGFLHDPERGTAPPGMTEKEYVAKADVYWKMNWVKNSVEAGIVPDNLSEALSEMRKQMVTLEEDDKKPLMREILDHIERGKQAEDLSKELRRQGLDTTHIAWGMGTQTIASRLKEDAKRGRLSGLLLSERGDLEQRILSFESLYASSPDAVKAREFTAAGVKINELGGKLRLLGRRENSPSGLATIPSGGSGQSFIPKISDPGLKSPPPEIGVP